MNKFKNMSISFLILFGIFAIWLIFNSIYNFESVATLIALILWIGILTLNVLNLANVIKKNKMKRYRGVYISSWISMLLILVSIIIAFTQIQTMTAMGIASLIFLILQTITFVLYTLFLILLYKKNYLARPVQIE